MSVTTPRIGLLGVAHGHAESYLTCLRQRRDIELVGLYNDDPAPGRALAEQFATTFFSSAEDLLGHQLDGVIICAETVKHRPLVEAAAGRVAAILCEKPIATTLEDAQAMITTCAANQTRLQIAFPVRFAPPIQWLKHTLEQGDLGAVYAVQTTNHGQMPGGWFVDRTLAGGGAVLDHTVHVIDLLRWFWQTEVSEVYAEVGDSLLHPGLGIDDVGLLSFTLANGVYGTLDTSWSRPASYPIWGDVKIEVTAEQGVVYLDVFAQNVTVTSDRTGSRAWRSWGSSMDQGLINDFIGMIQHDQTPSISGEDGLAALAVALAAYQSARSGQPIKLPHNQPTKEST